MTTQKASISRTDGGIDKRSKELAAVDDLDFPFTEEEFCAYYETRKSTGECAKESVEEESQESIEENLREYEHENYLMICEMQFSGIYR